MKISDFIFNVLQDIEDGLKKAEEKTDKEYFVKVDGDNGVHFDIAVTTTTSTGSQTEGKAKASVIEVLGAGVGFKQEDKDENSQVSRIQFSVKVPPNTKTAYKGYSVSNDLEELQ